MTRKTTRIILILLTVLLQYAVTPGFSDAATPAAQENHLTGLSVEETPKATRVHIGITAEPTFSVYQLRNPNRLLLEVSNCDLNKPLDDLLIRNGVLDRASAVAESDSGHCRVVLSFDQFASYNVETNDHEIIIVVDGTQRRKALTAQSPDASKQRALEARLAERESELHNTQDHLSKTLGDLEKLEQERRQAQQHVDRLLADQATLKDSVKDSQQLEDSLTSARENLSRLRSETRQTSESVAALRGELQSLKKSKGAAEEKIEGLISQKDRAEKRANLAEAKASSLSGEVQQLKQSMDLLKDSEQEQLSALKRRLELAHSQHDTLQKEYTTLGHQSAQDRSQNQASHAQDKETLLQKEEDLKVALVTTEKLDAKLKMLRERSSSEQLRMQAILTTKTASLSEANKRSRKLDAEKQTLVTKLSSELDARDKKLAEKEHELAALKKQEQALRKKLASSDAEHKSNDKETLALLELKERQGLIEAELRANLRSLRSSLHSREEALQASSKTEETLRKTFLQKSHQHKTTIRGLEKNLETGEKTLSETQARARLLEGEVLALEQALKAAQTTKGRDKLKEKQAALESVLNAQDSAQKEVSALSQDLARNQLELKTLQSQIAQAQAQAQSSASLLKSEQAHFGQMLKRSEVQLSSTRAERDQFAKKLAKSEAELKTLRAEAAKASGETLHLRSQLSQAQQKGTRATSLRSELSSTQAQLALASDTSKTHAEEIESLSSELQRAKTKQAQSSISSKEDSAQISTLQTQLETAKRQLKASQEYATKTASLQAQLATSEADRAELKNLQTQLRRAERKAASIEKLKEQLADAEIKGAETKAINKTLRRAVLKAGEVEGLKLKLAEMEKRAAELEELKTQLAKTEQEAAEVAPLKVQLAKTEQEAAEVAPLKLQLAKAEQEAAEVAPLKAQLAKAEQEAAEVASLKVRLVKAEREAAEVAPLKAELAKANAPLDLSTESTTRFVSKVSPAPLDEAHNAHPRAAFKPTAKTPKTTPTKTSDATLAKTIIKDVRFERRGNISRILIDVEGGAKYQTTSWGSSQATLVIDNAKLPAALERRLDTRAQGGAVNFISALREKGKVRFIVDLSGENNETMRREDDTLIWEFIQRSDSTGNKLASASTPSRFIDRRQKVKISAAPPSRFARGNSGAAGRTRVRYGSLKGPRLSRRRITLKVRDADINDLLRLIADVADVSIVTSPDVEGEVTLSLQSIPLDQALNTILKSQGLGMEQEGNVIWIAKQEVFEEREKKQRELKALGQIAEPLEVRLLPVNYATAEDLSKNIESLLSSRGTVQVDPRTNTLIIKDIADNLNAAEVLVESLDTQTPQILIEARIVETQSNFRQEFGIQWGGDFGASPSTGNPTGLSFPSSVGIAGGAGNQPNAGSATAPNFAINLPAAAGQGTGGAVGMTFGSVGGVFNLNLRLSAMEENGFVKIISAPRIVTLDNVPASIEQGVSIPVSVVSAAGVQTVFFDAKLNLSVVPHVTKDGNIFLKIDVTKNEPDFSRPGASGDPSIIRKEAHTQLLVPDGDTTVIGGIYTRNTAQSMSSIPWIGRIPILGYFFRRTTETDDRTELLIFISPRIVNRESSIGASGPGSFLAPVSNKSSTPK